MDKNETATPDETATPEVVAKGAAPRLRFGRSATEKRFIAVFGAVVIVFGIAAYTAMQGLHELHELMHQTIRRRPLITLVQQLQGSVQASSAHSVHVSLLGASAHLAHYRHAHAESISIANQMLKAAIDDEDVKEIRGIIVRLNELDKAFRDEILPAAQRGDSDAVRSAQIRSLGRIASLSQVLDRLAQRAGRVEDSFDEHASAIAHGGYRNTVVLLLGAAFFTILVGLYLARSVALPVALLQRRAERLAEGDLDARIEIDRPPEFRRLAEQFNFMAAATKENQARALAAERLAGVGRLAAGVAHEINNPLAVIQGYTKLLLKRADEGTAADLRIIKEECDRCSAIVRGLLDLSRPPIGELHDVELRELVDETIERLEQTARTDGIKIAVTGTARAHCDQRSVRQVLLNLIANACESCGKTGRVDVTIENTSDDELDKVKVCVADTGSGLPSDRSRLFEPFFTTKPSGTGLGLAVSRSIARAHGGDVTADNRPTGGAEFVLSLPAENDGEQT